MCGLVLGCFAAIAALSPADIDVCTGKPSDGRAVEVPAASAFTASVWAEISEPCGPQNACPRFFQLPYGYLHAYQSLSNPETVDLVLGFNVPKSERAKNGVSSWAVEAAVPMRRWAHVALVARAGGDEGLPELYVNGVRIGERMRSKPMPATFPTGIATVGNTAPGGTRPFFGRLAGFSFVPRAMGVDEIAACATRGPDGRSPKGVTRTMRDDLPIVDLAHDVARQTVVASGAKGPYQGHPTTVVASDGSLFCVWTINHGGPCGPMARSTDGGCTWTRCDGIMPNVYTNYSNCPTLQKIVRRDGGTNLAVFSNCRGKCGIVISEDGGTTWKAAPLADVSSGMPPTGFIMLKDGSAALFGQVHKQGVTGDRPNSDQDIWMSISKDDGWTWGPMCVVASVPAKNLCEPCCLRSPDGQELCLLMRENRHGGNSMMCFSRDEGKTWTRSEETCWGLSGDRHEAAYLPDGRLIVAFRDRAIGSSTYGHYVAWVGSYADLRAGKSGAGGDVRVWLTDSQGEAVWDTGYSGVEVLKDGTVVCTTYVRYRAADAGNSIVSTRFTLADLQKMAK